MLEQEDFGTTKKFYKEIIELILSGKIKNKDSLHKAKVRLSGKYGFKKIPRDSKILENLPKDIPKEEREKILSLIRKKPMRTISGVAVIAAMTSPASCPHGKCIPCPGGPEKNTPQSYTGYEPAAMRAINNNFDPFLQTRNRLLQLKNVGHPVDKIDFIVMGGTFTSRNIYYQEWFIKRCYDALNEKESKNLEDAKKLNENAPHRCIGLTIETRPDWLRLQHIDNILYYGATRVELGVQTIFDDVLHKMRRGHTVTDSIRATELAKNAGLKVCYHMMPGLPGSNIKKDLECFKTIFNDSKFKPDMIKIYPTLVIRGTRLYEMWENGEYEPLTDEKAIKLIAKIKEFVPRWVRIQRVERDVPANQIEAGVKKSNLRQLVEKEMRENRKKCNCIRCREIGHKLLKGEIKELPREEDIKLSRIEYEASGFKEIFLSLEDEINDAIIGYLRLRDINFSHRWELEEPCMIIRELKVLGKEIPIGEKIQDGWQHKGYGSLLIKEAEKICKDDFGKKLLFVLSGIGVKPYYRKLGFKDKGVYMYKKLSF